MNKDEEMKESYNQELNNFINRQEENTNIKTDIANLLLSYQYHMRQLLVDNFMELDSMNAFERVYAITLHCLDDFENKQNVNLDLVSEWLEIRTKEILGINVSLKLKHL